MLYIILFYMETRMISFIHVYCFLFYDVFEFSGHRWEHRGMLLK